MAGVLIGKAMSGKYVGQNVSFSPEDRDQHTYILGASGSGKSELLKVLIHHDLQAGHAVVVLDAHSDLCKQITDWPEFEPQHQRRVMLVTPNLFDGMTPTINLLQVPKGADDRAKEILANRIGQVIGEICHGEGGATISTRMDTIAKSTIRVLLDFENTTLKDLADFLSDEPPASFVRAGRASVNKGVRDLFQVHWDSSDYTASKAAMRTRLMNLLVMSDFHAMTCGPNTIPLYDWLDEGGTALFSFGAAGTETAQTLGRMVTAMVSAYGDLRKGTGQTNRIPVHFFIDECQNFVGGATRTIVSEMRKYGIHLTLAHQYADQIPAADLKAHLNNTRIKFLGATAYSPVMTDLMGCSREIATNLPNRQFLVKWGSHGETIQVQVRSDLADNRHRMHKLGRMAVRIHQKRFYRSFDDRHHPVPKNASTGLLEGSGYEFD